MTDVNDNTSETDASSPVAQPKMKLWKKILLWIGVIGIILIIVLIMNVPADKETDLGHIQEEQVGGLGTPLVPVPRETPPPPDQRASSVAARPGSAPASEPGMLDKFVPGFGGGSPRSVPIKHYQAPSSLASPGSLASTPVAAGGPGVGQAGAGSGDALDQKLGAASSHGVSVGTMLPDPHLFLTVGTGMPCISEQPINTDVPGPFNCFIRGNVMGHSGAVSLLDDSTKITGRIAESLGRGKRRAFGVVTRVATPQGCIINLRAPVGDQLGVAGLDGEVNNHFFERFRGVGILALFDAGSQAAAIAASNAIGGGNGISFNQLEMGGRELGEGTAGDDINIPPTLERAQAKHMLIMINEDIDMRACYKLRMAR